MYSTLFPLRSTSLYSFIVYPFTTSFEFVSKTFIVPSKQLRTPTKKVSLSFSFTSTGFPNICFKKSAGSFRLFIFGLENLQYQYTNMIGALLETVLLFLNAIAILNEKRFLKKYGFSTAVVTAPINADPSKDLNQNETITSKSQIIMMIFTLRSMGKYLLIPLNLFAILMELVG